MVLFGGFGSLYAVVEVAVDMSEIDGCVRWHILA